MTKEPLQALHDENKRLGLYEQGYADAMNWKTANHLEHLPTKQEQVEPDYKTLAIQLQQQRTWVGLTELEIEQGNKESWVTTQAFESAVWWAEAKLKEKNNGT